MEPPQRLLQIGNVVELAPANSLDRILSKRNLVRGNSGIALIWSFAAAMLLLLSIFSLGLTVELVIDRGRLEANLDAQDAERFMRLTGLKVSTAAVAEQPAEDGSAPPPSIHVSYDEHGLLPAVWRTRNRIYGPLVATLYRNVGWLQSNVLALVWLLSVTALSIVLRTACLRRLRLRSDRAALIAVMATRRNLHRQVLRLGPEDLDGTGYTSAVDMFFAEVEAIHRNLCDSIRILVRYPLEFLVLLLVVLSIDWRLSLQWIVPLALGLILLDRVRLGAVQQRRLAEDRGREEAQLLRSALKNARLVRGLGIEQSEHDWFQKHLERYHERLTEASRAADLVEQPQWKVVASATVLMAFLLFMLFDSVLMSGPASNTGVSFPEAIAFLIAMAIAVPGVIACKSLRPIRRDLRIAADRVRLYLERIPSVSQAVGAKFLQPMSKTLHFENVKYETPQGRKVLNGVDFKLEVDKCYAIVSVDPLEARAIALMLPRFIEPREGRVMIDGEDIAWVTLESLRAETAFVAADDPPFEGTVLDNIRGGQTELSLQQVTDAAKLTHAHNFIVKLFNGYETVLESHGDTLDAGQRFRLSLARAIVRDPALLIIEEPNEALDDDTKALLSDAYDRICRSRTVIFLPARMSTVRRTDQVVVIYEGKVAAFGPHAKLVNQSPVFRHWEYLRFNEFRHDA